MGRLRRLGCPAFFAALHSIALPPLTTRASPDARDPTEPTRLLSHRERSSLESWTRRSRLVQGERLLRGSRRDPYLAKATVGRSRRHRLSICRSDNLPRVGEAIGQFLPLAVGVALSPVPIIVVIVMLFSPHAKSNGPTYLLGWVIAVGAAAGIALAASDVASVGSEDAATNGASWVKLALGVLLLLGARRQWRTRPAPGNEPSMPTWMGGIDTFKAPKAFGLAVLLGLKPKNLILSAAAGTTIAQADLPRTQQCAALVIFIVLASAAIAIPVLYHAFGGDRAQRTMDGWRLWLQRNNAVVMTVLFLVFGFVLSGQAIQTLSA